MPGPEFKDLYPSFRMIFQEHAIINGQATVVTISLSDNNNVQITTQSVNQPVVTHTDLHLSEAIVIHRLLGMLLDVHPDVGRTDRTVYPISLSVKEDSISNKTAT